MTLVTAHKILIGSTIACALVFAAWSFRAFSRQGSGEFLASGIAGIAVAVGFTAYLRRVGGRARTGTPPS